MSKSTQTGDTGENSIIFSLSQLDPHTVEELVQLLTRLTQLIELQCHESLRRAYEQDARHDAQNQLPLDLFDDSDISPSVTEPPPF
jgi:hypothetical protein